MKAEVLRKSILQMAIQGKLVPQNSSDEPASVLLQKIRAEKENLIKEGKIKRDKTDSVIFKGEDGKFYEKTGKEVKDITDQLPFEIHDSWIWSRVSTCYDIRNGFTPLRSETRFWENGTIPWFTVDDIRRQGKLISYTQQHITCEAVNRDRIVPPNSFLLCCTASIGAFAQTTIALTTNQQFNSLTVKYLYRKLLQDNYLYGIGDYFADILHKLAGKTTFEFVSTKKLGEILIPIPPYEEQKRIVEAIEKFEPLIAEYDKLEQQAKKLDGEIFDKLKKSILHYAIQGKLVPQDSSDEPASVLLSKIKAEKEKLIKEGKIKKEKPLPPITDSEKPFDIPDSWQWVRLGELATKFTDGTHSTPKYVLAGVPFLSVKDMSRGFLDFSNTKFISEEEHEILYKRCNPEKGDLLITKVGTTGIPVIVDTDKQFSLFVSVALMKFSKRYLDVNFLKELINSPLVQQQAQENTRGVGNKNWVLDDIRNTIVPLPPLNEQKRIVARIQELFSEIDKINRQ